MKRRTTCADHAVGPSGPDNYAHWHKWAEQMAKTHRQRFCNECGRWAIWEPKDGAA